MIALIFPLKVPYTFGLLAVRLHYFKIKLDFIYTSQLCQLRPSDLYINYIF